MLLANMQWRWFFIVLLILLFALGTNKSDALEEAEGDDIGRDKNGDELPEFISCVNSTIKTECHSSNNATLPLYLQLTLWTCEDNCKYNCMHNISDTRPPPLLQFEGKWPFYRLLGIQEPASVLFSLGNLLMHYYYLRVMTGKHKNNKSTNNKEWMDDSTIPKNYYMWPFILGYCWININTWIQSSFFHTRDLPWTEKLDYFSAAMSILYSVYFAILRIFHIEQRARQLWIGGVLLVLYLVHVGFMSFVSFHYVYNMIACGIFAFIQGAMWVLWYIVAFLKKDKRVLAYGHWVIYATGANAMAILLEVFDFPPLGRVLDAHSLWHFSTIFVTPLWYHFVIQDSLSECHWSLLPQTDDENYNYHQHYDNNEVERQEVIALRQ
ncbi:Per1-like-domain-containing protein [Phascolomyces articulosus]|uniref:Post-GPI attachment to proteins factor 3 n=1 Tax=Phascolomyces articulosus TaxID=60185 RepID=A0AAD5P9T5_9FUNG|nr:Per1-like-domain-containing protein [Phascolomyces articulosus]